MMAASSISPACYLWIGFHVGKPIFGANAPNIDQEVVKDTLIMYVPFLASFQNTVDFGYKDRSGPGQIVPYVRMSLITDGNYVHSGQTNRKTRPS